MSGDLTPDRAESEPVAPTGLLITEEASQGFAPARPLPTDGLLAGGVLVSLVMVALAVVAVQASAGQSGMRIILALIGLCGIVAAVVSCGRAVIERSRCNAEWRACAWVAARHAAATSRHASLVAVGLGGFFLVLLAIGVFITTNDGAVRSTFLQGELMKASVADITKALRINILIAVGAEVMSLALGLLLALVRQMRGTSSRPLRFLAVTYIDVFRGLPAIVVIYLVCFGIPLTEIPVLSEQSPTLYAIVALTMTYAAYQAEQFRAGIEAVHRSQRSAALSLGLTPAATMRMVVLPQVVRTIAAPMLSVFIGLQKDTALVYVVGVMDAFTQAKIYSANYFNLSSVTVVCVLFVVLTIPQTRLVDYLVSRQDRRLGRVM
ncbi:MAG: amino acid ABC transporter permease [Nocardioides sp.]|uniref:amino acid ABC transporter permease n=1 Tax=Nocardioides sp. TaxID=35761 RepID=UPI0039E21539